MGMADDGASVATGWAKILVAVISPPTAVVSGVSGNVEAVGRIEVGVGIVPVKIGWSVLWPEGSNVGIMPLFGVWWPGRICQVPDGTKLVMTGGFGVVGVGSAI